MLSLLTKVPLVRCKLEKAMWSYGEVRKGRAASTCICLLCSSFSLFLNMVCSIICVSFLDLLLRSVHAEPRIYMVLTCLGECIWKSLVEQLVASHKEYRSNPPLNSIVGYNILNASCVCN